VPKTDICPVMVLALAESKGTGPIANQAAAATAIPNIRLFFVVTFVFFILTSNDTGSPPAKSANLECSRADNSQHVRTSPASKGKSGDLLTMTSRWREDHRKRPPLLAEPTHDSRVPGVAATTIPNARLFFIIDSDAGVTHEGHQI
jgi:hypothetical protein